MNILLACPKCQLELRVKKNSVGAEMMSQSGSYKYYDTDLFYCPDCGMEVMVGTSSGPLVECHDPRYSHLLRDLRSSGPVFQIWYTRKDRSKAIQ